MRKFAATVAIVTVASVAFTPLAFARGGSSGSSFGGGGRGWVGGTQNPEDFPNCMMWSQRDHAYVWLCGKPYPPGYIHS